MARFIKLDRGFSRDMGNPVFRPILVNVDRIEAVAVQADGVVAIFHIDDDRHYIVKQSFEEVEALLNGNPNKINQDE